jgi:hypothetical protein
VKFRIKRYFLKAPDLSQPYSIKKHSITTGRLQQNGKLVGPGPEFPNQGTFFPGQEIREVPVTKREYLRDSRVCPE